MTPKPWYTSRTIWLQIGTVAAMVLAAVLQNAGMLAVPPALVPWIGIVLAGLNAALRLDTAQPISGTPAATAQEAQP